MQKETNKQENFQIFCNIKKKYYRYGSVQYFIMGLATPHSLLHLSFMVAAFTRFRYFTSLGLITFRWLLRIRLGVKIDFWLRPVTSRKVSYLALGGHMDVSTMEAIALFSSPSASSRTALSLATYSYVDSISLSTKWNSSKFV